MDLFSPLLDRVEFRVNRVAVFSCTIAAAGLATLLGYLALTTTTPSTAPGHVIAATTALSGSMLLYATAIALCLRYVLRCGAVVTVDEKGILDRRIGPYVLPWSQIRDVRFLDRQGYRVGIELDRQTLSAPRHRCTREEAVNGTERSAHLAVINTVFLQSEFRDRALGFLIPLTAVAPFDFNDVAVSETTLQADALLVRRRHRNVAAFFTVTLILPAVAGIYLVAA